MQEMVQEKRNQRRLPNRVNGSGVIESDHQHVVTPFPVVEELTVGAILQRKLVHKDTDISTMA